MPHKKKVIEPIVGPGKKPEDKLTVQKSIPLFSLWRSDMSLTEFKILDTYLSRINSHDPDKRTVVFTKGELECLLGVTRINKPDLIARLKGLYRGVDVECSNKRIHTIGLFEEACGEMDENGQWTVKLTCTTKAMKYIFNIENLGYLRYKLRCITNLTSRYTYVLFMYLESNRFRKSWEVDVAELKQVLNCDTEPTYTQFKRFNDLILKKCQKELQEKTECRYSYAPIKKGRTVVAIRFDLETLPRLEEDADPDQGNFDDYLQEKNTRDSICHGFGNQAFSVFSDDELAVLKDLAWPHARQCDINRHNDALGDYALACEYACADYLRAQIKSAQLRKPKHLFAYLKKMIESEN